MAYGVLRDYVSAATLYCNILGSTPDDVRTLSAIGWRLEEAEDSRTVS
jgi:hypothetical protein